MMALRLRRGLDGYDRVDTCCSPFRPTPGFGHYRRYERADLVRLLRESGLEIEHLECYGYPITNIGERIAARSYARRIMRPSGGVSLDRRASTDRSGIERGPHVRMYPLLTSWPGRLGLMAALAVQRLFLGADLGSGYVLRARKL